MNFRLFCMISLLSGLAAQVAAQDTKILNGRDLTESALVQALTPPADAPLERKPVLTRGIRVSEDNKFSPTRKSLKQASAHLLITFETNSAELTAPAKQSLDLVGKALGSSKLSDFRFAIQGHADPRGESEANLKLSQLRAESVRRYLVNASHINDSRLDAVGKGDKEPLNLANPIAPENRRVTIVNLLR